MPSITHEGIRQPFEHRPALAAELLADPLGYKLPTWRHARLSSGDLTEVIPTEYVVTDVERARRSPELAVLSALAHGSAHPHRPQVLAAFLEALRVVEPDRARIYTMMLSTPRFPRLRAPIWRG